MIIFEDSQKVTKRKAPVPKKDREYYGALYNALEKVTPKNKLKNLKSLASTKKYNKKGADAKKNGDEQNLNYVSVEDAKKRMERMSPNDITQGGQKAYDFYKRTIQRARSQEKVSKIEPPKPTSNTNMKPLKVDVKDINRPNGKISYNVTSENKIIKEGIEDNKFYEYLEEYGANYVFELFMENPKGKENWGVLINPSMYAKALREFTQHGKLINFPSRYVYQWMGIIMRNTAILYANTQIAGHTSSFPYEEFDDFMQYHFGNDREIEVNYGDDMKIEITQQEVIKLCNDENPLINENAIDKYGQTYLPWINQADADRLSAQDDMNRFKEKYGEITDYIEKYNNNDSYHQIEINPKNGKLYWTMSVFTFLDDIGIFDWMEMPDGSDAWSDYGLDPLMKIFTEYDEELPPEKVLVLVNRALDVYHQRGDMASIFIQGGSSALSRIAEDVERKKKTVIISEEALKRLAEDYRQLKIPFKNGLKKGFDEKENYEHFIDYLEYIGKYGTLQNSGIKPKDIPVIIEQNAKYAIDYLVDEYESDHEYNIAMEAFNSMFNNMRNENEVYTYFTNLPLDYRELYYKVTNEYYGNLSELLADNDLMDEDPSPQDVKEFLTSQGVSLFEKYMEQTVIDLAEENGVPQCFEMNERGLIYIEREITMPDVHSIDFVDRMHPDNKTNYFQYISKRFEGIGSFWTYLKGAAEAYCGDTYDGVKTDYIILKGWVNPNSVNWEETLTRNVYSLRSEHEIYINSYELIEIDEIIISSNRPNRGKRILNKPILVRI